MSINKFNLKNIIKMDFINKTFNYTQEIFVYQFE